LLFIGVLHLAVVRCCEIFVSGRLNIKKVLLFLFHSVLVTIDVARGCQGGHALPQIFSISCHFLLWKAVSRTKCYCSLEDKVFVPQKNLCWLPGM